MTQFEFFVCLSKIMSSHLLDLDILTLVPLVPESSRDYIAKLHQTNAIVLAKGKDAHQCCTCNAVTDETYNHCTICKGYFCEECSNWPHEKQICEACVKNTRMTRHIPVVDFRRWSEEKYEDELKDWLRRAKYFQMHLVECPACGSVTERESACCICEQHLCNNCTVDRIHPACLTCYNNLHRLSTSEVPHYW